VVDGPAPGRRSLLRGAGGLAAAAVATRPALLGRTAAAAPPSDPEGSGDPLWLSAGQGRDGVHRVAGVATDGGLRFALDLPARGHAAAVRPGGGEAVICARRPGTFAAVIDLAAGGIRRRIPAAAGRHFYGHGAFSADGRRFYATENAYGTGQGRIGLYDAADGYRRLGEWSSHGIGPHDLRLLPDGRTLAVAIGGIRTHPASGREKLNLDTMAPALVLLDTADGSLLARLPVPESLRQLSLRHLAVGRDGRIAVVMQYQGAATDWPPLVAFARPDGGPLAFAEAPEPVLAAMANYCGSAAFDRSGTILGVSSPRGGLFTFWSAEGGLLATAPVTDGCGIAAAVDGPGRFVLSSGVTGLWRFDVAETRLDRLAAPTAPVAHWDNHLTPA